MVPPLQSVNIVHFIFNYCHFHTVLMNKNGANSQLMRELVVDNMFDSFFSHASSEIIKNVRPTFLYFFVFIQQSSMIHWLPSKLTNQNLKPKFLQELIMRRDSERELLRSTPGRYPNSLK